MITPGQTHDIKAAAELLATVGKGQMVIADKAYDADWLRAMVTEQGRMGQHPVKIEPQGPYLLLALALQEAQLDRALL